MRKNEYKDILLAQWSLIDHMATRRFPGSLAEEAALYVLEKLQEDNCRRLRNHDGRAAWPAFIGLLTSRLLEDFSRKKFGRLRPPAWLRKLDGIWLELYDFLCRQRLAPDDAVEMVLMRTTAAQKRVEEAAWTILGRITDCGRHQGLEVELVENESPSDSIGQNHRQGPEETMAAAERRLFFSLLLETDVDAAQMAGLDRLVAVLRESRMSAEERLLLQMIYRDQIPVREAGRLLGLNVNQVHGRLRRLLARLRQNLQQAGLEEELRLLL